MGRMGMQVPVCDFCLINFIRFVFVLAMKTIKKKEVEHSEAAIE
jgi:large-conductance mechanosensitive channel